MAVFRHWVMGPFKAILNGRHVIKFSFTFSSSASRMVERCSSIIIKAHLHKAISLLLQMMATKFPLTLQICRCCSFWLILAPRRKFIEERAKRVTLSFFVVISHSLKLTDRKLWVFKNSPNLLFLAFLLTFVQLKCISSSLRSQRRMRLVMSFLNNVHLC